MFNELVMHFSRHKEARRRKILNFFHVLYFKQKLHDNCLSGSNIEEDEV
jgi:hypothetical protein